MRQIESTHELSFEQPLRAIERELAQLAKLQQTGVDFTREIAALEGKAEALSRQIVAKLTPWQVVQIARHSRRPGGRELVAGLVESFVELRGDRRAGDDAAIAVGVGRFDGQPIAVIASCLTSSDAVRSQAMSSCGLGKVERVARLAERFHLPLVALVAGASRVVADARSALAAARAARALGVLGSPTLALFAGEVSGLATGVFSQVDSVLMSQYATVSVAPCEEIAAVCFEDPERTEHAARAMRLLASDALALGWIEQIVDEPLGGAHRDPSRAVELWRHALREKLGDLHRLEPAERQASRRARISGSWPES